MPAQLRRAPTFAGQPLSGRGLGINKAHWLASRLIFVHTGRDALFRGEVLPPVAGTLPIVRGAEPAAPGGPFEQSINFDPDGSGFIVYETPGHPGQGITAAAWVATGATYGSVVSSIIMSGNWGNSAAQGLQTAANTRSLRAGSYGASSGIAGAVTENALNANNVWRHGVARFSSNTSRQFLLDGAASATNTTSIASTPIHNRIAIGGLARNGGVTLPCISQISGVALPMLIDGVLTDQEVSRLYEEQRSNPWALFRERPRMIWLGAGAAPSIPTMSALARTNLRRPRYTWTP